MSRIHSLDEMKSLYQQLKPLLINKKIPIYIVESNIISKKLLQAEITKFGYQNFNNTLQGSDVFITLNQKEEDSIMIIPYGLTPLNGLQIVQSYKKLEKNIRTRICVTLNEQEQHLAANLLESGASAILFKPYDAKGVMQAFFQMEAI